MSFPIVTILTRGCDFGRSQRMAAFRGTSQIGIVQPIEHRLGLIRAVVVNRFGVVEELVSWTVTTRGGSVTGLKPSRRVDDRSSRHSLATSCIHRR